MQELTELFVHLGSDLRVKVPSFGQSLHIDFTRIGVFGDDIIQFWLRKLRLIGLIVPMATVADHVNKYVFVEFLPELSSQFSGKNYRFSIVSIHVNDRRIDNFGHISTID